MDLTSTQKNLLHDLYGIVTLLSKDMPPEDTCTETENELWADIANVKNDFTNLGYNWPVKLTTKQGDQT